MLSFRQQLPADRAGTVSRAPGERFQWKCKYFCMDFLKILLIEDDPMDQLIIRSVTEHAGFEVEVAENGREGIDKLRAGQYDLVLMDLEMPVMNGYETTAFIRQSLEGQKDIPIIIITSKEGLGEATRCLLLGANTFVTKPVNEAKLIQEINTLMIY
jgi:CheY-like chemotaxis protein